MIAPPEPTGQENVAREPPCAPKDPPEATEALRDILALLNELRAQALEYVSIRRDLIAAKIKRGVTMAVMFIVAGVAFAAVLCTAVGLALVGIARGLGELLGGRTWLGFLITGLVLLAAIGVGFWVAVKRWQKRSLENTIRKYGPRRPAAPNRTP